MKHLLLFTYYNHLCNECIDNYKVINTQLKPQFIIKIYDNCFRRGQIWRNNLRREFIFSV